MRCACEAPFLACCRYCPQGLSARSRAVNAEPRYFVTHLPYVILGRLHTIWREPRWQTEPQSRIPIAEGRSWRHSGEARQEAGRANDTAVSSIRRHSRDAYLCAYVKDELHSCRRDLAVTLVPHLSSTSFARRRRHGRIQRCTPSGDCRAPQAGIHASPTAPASLTDIIHHLFVSPSVPLHHTLTPDSMQALCGHRSD